MHSRNKDLNIDDDKSFSAVRFDTAANRTTHISESQYMSYCPQFSLRPLIREAGDRHAKVSVLANEIGVVKLQITFKDVKLVMDVDFLLFTGEVPRLLSMRDMLTKNLNISIQVCHISHGIFKRQLSMENRSYAEEE